MPVNGRARTSPSYIEGWSIHRAPFSVYEQSMKYRLQGNDPALAAVPAVRQWPLGRWLPFLLLLMVVVVVFATGWHRQLSLEALIRHRDQVDALVGAHHLAALAGFIVVYIAAVTLSLPGAAVLTVAGGLLFGTGVGGTAAVAAATIGATFVFLIARSAVGGWLVRRAGGLADRITGGFRRDAFHYLLFLRLVPIFPFWIVNLVAALAGVRLAPFVTATALGIVPGTIAFAFFGASLDHAVATQAASYRACLAGGGDDCRLDFDVTAVATPELVAALVVLGLIALAPVVLRRRKTLPPPSP
jgi:uncharacterized membrane protein YdjX (TVP38/TMEM64 family)